MLAKLNQYRQNLSFPLSKKNHTKYDFKTTTKTEYSFEWVENLKQLKEVQQFRAEQFANQFGLQFEHGLDQDVYDFGCEHAVLRDKASGEIVAYTRLKLFQGHELAQSYSASEFAIEEQLKHLNNIVEIGRTCVHPRHRAGKALSILWLNLVPKVLWSMKARYLIGCVSVRLEGNEARAYHTHQYIQQLSEQQRCSIASKQAYIPQASEMTSLKQGRIPKLFDIYLKIQGKLSTEAYYDQEFNCLDYFVFVEMNQVLKKMVLKKNTRHIVE